MGGKDWEQNFDLKSKLFEQGHQFSFIQAYRLIDLLLREELGDNYSRDAALQQIKIRPELSLNFPSSDISQIDLLEVDGKSIYQITATFLGLYGISSPLPSFYTEDLFRDQVDDNPLVREFIDIFNNHLYQLLLKIWDSHKLSYQVVEAKNPIYLSYLYRFGGIEHPSHNQMIPSQYNILRYLGIMGHLPRSALGLKIILADLLDVKNVEVLQCMDSVMDIPVEQIFSLGLSGSSLGEDAHLGNQIISASHAFTVKIGPVDDKEFKSLLPGSEKFQTIHHVVDAYIDQPLTYNVELVVSGKGLSTATLGNSSWSCLGHDTWIFADNDVKDQNYTLQFNDLDRSVR